MAAYLRGTIFRALYRLRVLADKDIAVGGARARALSRLRRLRAAARRSRAAHAFGEAKRMARPCAAFAEVGDESGERSEPYMREEASADRRRFERCDRTQRYQKPPCTVNAAAS